MILPRRPTDHALKRALSSDAPRVTRSRSSAAFRHRPCIAVSAVIRRGIARNFAPKEHGYVEALIRSRPRARLASKPGFRSVLVERFVLHEDAFLVGLAGGEEMINDASDLWAAAVIALGPPSFARIRLK